MVYVSSIPRWHLVRCLYSPTGAKDGVQTGGIVHGMMRFVQDTDAILSGGHASVYFNAVFLDNAL